MNIKQLKCFIVVYRKNSFTLAAEELNTVQSNVSAMICELEDFLGVQLFERLYRRIAPTESAHRLYAHAQILLSMFGQTKQVVTEAEPHQEAELIAVPEPAV